MSLAAINFFSDCNMKEILAMVEGSSTSEVKNFDQIDQSLFKEFLEKASVWDFHEMTKEQYSTKDEGEKKSLIINYYNAMIKGNFCYLWSAVFCWFDFLVEKV